MKKTFLFLFCVSVILACGRQENLSPMKGIILNTHDLSTVPDWPERAAENGINTISTHMFPGEVLDFIRSEKGQAFMKRCLELGIKVDHQLHAMGELLPRDLFSLDSTMYRMDERGHRVNDFNCCVHSIRALDTIAAHAVRVSKELVPTNHRYYYWLDDGKPTCQCDQCRQYTISEQALIIENHVVKALRKHDPQAMLAHLAYFNTLEAPRKVKPEEGVFLEFAPFLRSWEHPICDTLAQGRGMTHAQNLKYLKENLEVFPTETAVILEYWLDVSLFSGWKKPAVELPWRKDVFLADVETYRSMGIRHFTSFAVYMDSVYWKTFPDQTPLREYGEGLK